MHSSNRWCVFFKSIYCGIASHLACCRDGVSIFMGDRLSPKDYLITIDSSKSMPLKVYILPKVTLISH